MLILFFDLWKAWKELSLTVFLLYITIPQVTNSFRWSYNCSCISNLLIPSYRYESKYRKILYIFAISFTLPYLPRKFYYKSLNNSIITQRIFSNPFVTSKTAKLAGSKKADSIFPIIVRYNSKKYHYFSCSSLYLG